MIVYHVRNVPNPTTETSNRGFALLSSFMKGLGFRTTTYNAIFVSGPQLHPSHFIRPNRLWTTHAPSRET